MKLLFLSLFFISVLAITGCKKDNDCFDKNTSKKILVDASKDGGVWWYPQGPKNNDPNVYHQGQKLANYLRGLGYQVDELASGTRVSGSILQGYSKVIRAAAIYQYLPEEIEAYDTFLSQKSSLMLIQDHLANHPNDMLSKHLNVEFAGAGGTAITKFNSHAITKGVFSVPYIAGSGIVNTDKSHMTILGSLADTDFIDINNNGRLDSSDLIAAPVMGILHHPTSKIFFIGDINGIEQVPQPFTENLVNWLFN
jgi:hypothetical protein